MSFTSSFMSDPTIAVQQHLGINFPWEKTHETAVLGGGQANFLHIDPADAESEEDSDTHGYPSSTNLASQPPALEVQDYAAMSSYTSYEQVSDENGAWQQHQMGMTESPYTIPNSQVEQRDTSMMPSHSHGNGNPANLSSSHREHSYASSISAFDEFENALVQEHLPMSQQASTEDVTRSTVHAQKTAGPIGASKTADKATNKPVTKITPVTTGASSKPSLHPPSLLPSIDRTDETTFSPSQEQSQRPKSNLAPREMEPVSEDLKSRPSDHASSETHEQQEVYAPAHDAAAYHAAPERHVEQSEAPIRRSGGDRRSRKPVKSTAPANDATMPTSPVPSESGHSIKTKASKFWKNVLSTKNKRENHVPPVPAIPAAHDTKPRRNLRDRLKTNFHMGGPRSTAEEKQEATYSKPDTFRALYYDQDLHEMNKWIHQNGNELHQDEAHWEAAQNSRSKPPIVPNLLNRNGTSAYYSPEEPSQRPPETDSHRLTSMQSKRESEHGSSMKPNALFSLFKKRSSDPDHLFHNAANGVLPHRKANEEPVPVESDLRRRESMLKSRHRSMSMDHPTAYDAMEEGPVHMPRTSSTMSVTEQESNVNALPKRNDNVTDHTLRDMNNEKAHDSAAEYLAESHPTDETTVPMMLPHRGSQSLEKVPEEPHLESLSNEQTGPSNDMTKRKEETRSPKLANEPPVVPPRPMKKGNEKQDSRLSMMSDASFQTALTHDPSVAKYGTQSPTEGGNVDTLPSFPRPRHAHPFQVSSLPSHVEEVSTPGTGTMSTHHSEPMYNEAAAWQGISHEKQAIAMAPTSVSSPVLDTYSDSSSPTKKEKRLSLGLREDEWALDLNFGNDTAHVPESTNKGLMSSHNVPRDTKTTPASTRASTNPFLNLAQKGKKPNPSTSHRQDFAPTLPDLSHVSPVMFDEL
ncbi:hypothetical protein ACI68E_002114 [Malassezia pachydermatis]|uniref:Uncharacterized protein n=1 Tax=Malassezia pachydermatis TaxID=77020 RepID=A0A0M8MQK7_9BASI|nr:hypothetical protein Malapachy_1043 [Malassezia pachydermatis]KOS14847.1 hypothetical protein Malapachy_1043 [Malassezia pachydermatis]